MALGLPAVRAQIPAFPGAEGYGAYAKGGRGGDVYHVTNLSASGTGSFADAIATVPAAGRTIVFDVSGYIRLPSGSNGTRLTASKVTIAGQTAPGDGIGFTNNYFRISGDDIILRHLRFRHGKYGSGGDCIDLDSGSLNAILDHLSLQFSTDENLSSYGSPPENLTLQYSFNSWGLESHSCGGLWDQNHASAHHNLWSHNHTRNPKSRPSGLLEWINNVTFDWDIGFIMGDTYTPSTFKANVRSNYFICPPGNIKTYALEKGWLDSSATRKPTFSIYLDGNLMDRDGDGLLNGAAISYERVQGSEFDPAETVPSYSSNPDVARYYKNTTPFTGSTAGVTIDPALLAYKKIVSNAGALRLDADPARTLRDEVDTILINKLVSQTHFHVTRESDTGASNSGFGYLTSTTVPVDSDGDGMPDYWETALNGQNGMTFNVGTDDHNTVFTAAQLANTFFPTGTAVGYTYLEEYLYWLAIPHATVAKYVSGDTATFVDVDLRKFTSGFAAGVTYAVSNISGGITAIQADGHTARFTPTAGYVGRARFDFTVSDGQTWSQTCGILVSSSGLPRDLVWRGDGSSNVWDTTSTFWKKSDGVTSTAFSPGDTVLFDDRGAISPPISLVGTLAPSAVTVDTANYYNFQGSGTLSGAMELTKSGVGSLTISNTAANTYSGGTTVNEGTLYASRVDSLGSGKVTLAGGSLAFSSADNLTVPNALAITAPGSLATAHNTTFSGALTGAGDLNLSTTLLTPTATWAGYTGRFTLTNNGTLRFNQGANPWGGANAAFDAGTSGTIRNRSIATTTTTVTLGALSGGASSFLRGSDQDGGATDTYVIGGLNGDTTFAGTITNGTSGITPHPTALTKAGTGTLILSGTSTYTGATTLTAGTLLLSGSLANTSVVNVNGGALVSGSIPSASVTVVSGATLAGDGTLGGAVTANAGAILSPGTVPFTSGTMNIGSNGLTINGNTFYIDVTGAGNDKIVMNGGTLKMAGTHSFQFLLLNGPLAPGSYDLITGGSGWSLAGGYPSSFPHNLPTDTRQTFTVKRNASNLAPRVWLEVLNSVQSLTWTGAGGAVWDANTTVNWTGSTDGNNRFVPNDSVTFDDTATGGSVTLSGTVQPRVVTVNNSAAKPYTFAGTGSLGGSARLEKSGTGALTISPALVTMSSATTSASPTVTVTDASGLAVGMTAGGTGVPAGTTITAISGTTLTLSQNATATSSAASLSYYAAHPYGGGTVINAGSTITLANAAANAAGLGTGPITLNGGTLSMFKSVRFNSDAEINAPGVPEASTFLLSVPAGQTGTLNADSRCDLYGTLTGGGTFNFNVPWTRTTLFADWSAFNGIINVGTDGFSEPNGGNTVTGGDFRMGTPYSFPGFPLAAVNLGDKVSAYYDGIVAAGAGTTIEVGELSGTSLTYLLGGPTGGRTFTYRIGGRTPAGGEAVFAGAILERGATTTTNFVKTGPGIWRLAGACVYNGSTIIEQGTLRIAGTVESRGADFLVRDNTTLDLMNGKVTTSDVQVSANGKITGSGTIEGDLTNNGTITCTAGGLSVSGEVINNGTIRVTGGATFAAPGTFTNNGVLDLLTAGGTLPANLVNNGVVIDSRALKIQGASRSGTTFTATVASYTGHSYQLQRAPGLTPPAAWQNVDTAPAQTGVTQSNGQPTILTFTDTAASGNQGFYRVVVTP